MRLVGMPWVPPEAGDAVEATAPADRGGGRQGVEAAWFFQTGTSLPSAMTTRRGRGRRRRRRGRRRRRRGRRRRDEDDDLEVASWSHGAPPQLKDIRFPVDGYPAIDLELDWEDVGVAVKLEGPHVPARAPSSWAFMRCGCRPTAGGTATQP